jgi:hypothetical protein
MKIYKISKPRSRKYTEIQQNDSYDWFYTLTHYNNKKKEKVTERGTVIKKDLHLWLDRYNSEGYSTQEEDI